MNQSASQDSRLDSIPVPIVAACVILAGCGVLVLGMILLGYWPVTSLVLGMILLACAFSLLYGSPISLVLICMTGFLVIVSTMIGAQEVPELRSRAIVAGVIFAVVLALALSQVRWLFRKQPNRGTPPT